MANTADQTNEVYPPLGQPSQTNTKPPFDSAGTIDSILGGQERLNSLCGAKSFTKEVQTKLMAEITSIVKLAASAAFEVTRLQGELEKERENSTKRGKEEAAQASYAETAKRPPKEKKQKKEPASPPSIVLIYPKGKDTTRKILREHVPAEEIKITSTREIRKGGLLIKTKDKEEMKKLIQKIEESDAAKENLEVFQPQKRRPQMIVYGLEPGTDDNEVGQAFLKQDPKYDAEDCKIVHKQEKRDHVNYIVELHPELFNLHKERRRIRVGWVSATLREFLRPMQCYRCGLYGHTTKKCNADVDLCTNCGKPGHKWEKCQEKGNCVNCVRANERNKNDGGGKINTQHACTDANCPTYEMEMRWLRRKIDYSSTKHGPE